MKRDKNRTLKKTYSSDLHYFGTIEAAEQLLHVGDFMSDDGKYKNAEQLLLVPPKIYSAQMETEDPSTVIARQSLGVNYWRQGRFTEVADLQEQVLAVRKRVLGEDHPGTLSTMNNLGITYRNQGQLTRAADLQEQTLALKRRILGEDYLSTLNSMINVGAIYADQGRLHETVKLQEKAMSATRQLGTWESHPYLPEVMSDLGVTYLFQGQHSEALLMHRETLAAKFARHTRNVEGCHGWYQRRV